MPFPPQQFTPLAGIDRSSGLRRDRSHSRTSLPSGGFVYASLMLVCISAVVLSGCRGNNRFSVYPVSGRVIYGGRGIARATVIFFPVDAASENAKKLRPFAYCDGEGNFKLKTYTDDDGAPAGKYRVSIIAPARTRSGSSKDQPAGETPASQGIVVDVPPAIANKYSNVDTAGIEVTVQEGDNNLEPFELISNAGGPPRAASITPASAAKN